MSKILSLVLTLGVMILSSTTLPASANPNETKTGTQSVLSIEDPTPGYWETSEYLIGSVAVGIFLFESNGTIDPETEDWTSYEESRVISKIEYALNWWVRQNPSANVSFATDIHYGVPTSYEPIDHPRSDADLWITEAMAYLGYTYPYRQQDYINDLRDMLGTDWCFAMFVVDASNTQYGRFSDGKSAGAWLGGPSFTITYHSRWDLSHVVAHELGHIFWATDEYNHRTESRGYLDVPDVDGSGCLMETSGSWRLSGKPNGLEGTWGQVGWRDTDGDGIQDIVDTFPLINLDETPSETTNITLKYHGLATVTPYPNKNPGRNNPEGQRNVTINKITRIEFRTDGGQWINVNATDGSFGDAVEEFEFVTPPLSPGEHFLEVRATNNWGNSGYANDTVTILEAIHDIAVTEINPEETTLRNNTDTTIDVTVENQGDASESFSITLSCNLSQIGTQTVILAGEESRTLTFDWTTPVEPGNYIIVAEVSRILGEIDAEDNVLTCDVTVTSVSLIGDINGDGVVDIFDIVEATFAIDSRPGDYNWNQSADLNNDYVVDIFDVVLLAQNFGKTG